jgi:hypothetical protein
VFVGSISCKEHVQHCSSYGARHDMLGQESAHQEDMAQTGEQRVHKPWSL